MIRRVVVEVIGCSRCGKNHRDVEFNEFAFRNVVCGDVEISHWGTCPETKEPVLMRIRLGSTAFVAESNDTK